MRNGRAGGLTDGYKEDMACCRASRDTIEVIELTEKCASLLPFPTSSSGVHLLYDAQTRPAKGF